MIKVGSPKLMFETFKAGVFYGVEAPEGVLREKYRKLMSRYDLQDPSYRIFVAEDEGGRFAGVIWVGVQKRSEVERLEEDERYAWIYDIEVAPESRGRGLGRRLLDHAEDWAREQGIGKVELHVFAHNEEALLLAKYLRGERRAWVPRIAILPFPFYLELCAPNARVRACAALIAGYLDKQTI